MSQPRSEPPNALQPHRLFDSRFEFGTFTSSNCGRKFAFTFEKQRGVSPLGRQVARSHDRGAESGDRTGPAFMPAHISLHIG